MRPAVSQLLCKVISMQTMTSSAKESVRHLSYTANGVLSRSSSLISAHSDSPIGLSNGGQDLDRAFVTGKSFYSTSDYSDYDPPERVSRPPNLEARMRMKAYRRQALAERRNLDIEEEARNIDMDPAKMLKKGDPGTVQAIIRDVMPVGYFLNMPSGREGYLPATDLGTTGGIVLLERLMKVGQELTVRITKSIKIRDIVSIRPEGWVSPVENPFLPKNKT